MLATSVWGSARRSELLGKLPLRFEENCGRDPNPEVKYVARQPKFQLSLAPGQSWLEWKDSSLRKTARVHTRLQGANRDAQMEPADRLPGSANYFLGTAENWRTDVTGYGRIRYRNVYPGIDLVFHGEAGRLEYDFILAPYADPGAIRLELSGQHGLRIDPEGDLVVSTEAGEIRWKHPSIYQTAGGTRATVAGRFVLRGKREVRFEIGAYNRDRELVIDPVLHYLTYLGGPGNDAARGIAVDQQGNVYIAGTSSSADLPTVSAYQPNFAGMTANMATGDGFVAKFSPAGSLLYLTYLGGSQDDGVTALAVDSSGNAYLTGATDSPDFPTLNPIQSKFGGLGGNGIRTGDAFIAKLNATGNKLIYSTYLGGDQDDIGLAIAVDASGNAYVGGATASLNFPLTPGGGAYQSRLIGVGGEPIRHVTDTVPEWEPGDAFVAKIDPTGSKLIFSTFLGGSLDDAALSIAVDQANNVYVGGCTISYDFPTTAGALQRGWGGQDPQNLFFHLGDGFIAKLNPTGSALVYSTYFGGRGDDCITGIAVDPSGSVYFTGTTSTTNLPTTPGAIQPSYAGYLNLPFAIEMLFGDAFVAKLNPAGSQLEYLTYLGGSKNDGGTAIAIDSKGDAFVTGFTDSPDFPLSGSPLQATLAGDGGIGLYLFYGDAFLAVINPTGTALLYSSYFGGNEDERTFGLAVDGSGSVYLAGNTVSTNLPTTPNAIQSKFGGFDGHVAGVPRGDAFYAVFSGFPLGPPVITAVDNAESDTAIIAPNTWISIKGSNLAPDMRIWLASDFINNQMPTALDGASVTINGKKAYVYYISATQINVLTPPDIPSGPLQVQVSNSGFTSQPFTVTSQQYSISFFALFPTPYVLATHLDGSLIGPSNLYPGLTTPAAPGEQIILYANGYGRTSDPVNPGAMAQSGTLPSLPPLQIGGNVASVTFAGLVSPGLYQFNVIIPPNAANGDAEVKSEYGGQVTKPGTLITIHQ